jgi:hypothetical protein
MNIGNTVYEIGGLEQTVRTWKIEDVVRGDSDDPYWWVIMTSDQFRVIVKEQDLKARLAEQKSRDELTGPTDTRDKGRWRTFNPRRRGQGIVPAEPDTDFDRIDRALSPRRGSDLDFERTRDLSTVNDFLDHPALVSHDLGGTNFPVAIFTARSPYDGSIVGTVVLKKPSARALDDWEDGGPHNGGDGTRVEVARLATRVDRPANTASWMLARSARWADQQGFGIIQAYAGMANNRGTCYDAAGFDVQATDAEADGAAWNSADDRDGRVVVQDGGTWTRRRWERDL